jgi:hypothetical protein
MAYPCIDKCRARQEDTESYILKMEEVVVETLSVTTSKKKLSIVRHTFIMLMF